jgi:hypothetical protein
LIYNSSGRRAFSGPLIEPTLKLGKVDAKNFITDRYLKKREEEGFVQ